MWRGAARGADRACRIRANPRLKAELSRLVGERFRGFRRVCVLRPKNQCLRSLKASLLGDHRGRPSGARGQSGVMDVCPDDYPDPVASASRSTIQNSQDAANASSGSSGVTKSTTAQHRTASDAEPSGAKASPPAGTVTKSPSSRPVRRCSSGDCTWSTARIRTSWSWRLPCCRRCT